MGGRNALGDGSVSTGGMPNPDVDDVKVAEAGGVGNCCPAVLAQDPLITESKEGDCEGVRSNDRCSSAEDVSQVEMEGNRSGGGATGENLDVTVLATSSHGFPCPLLSLRSGLGGTLSRLLFVDSPPPSPDCEIGSVQRGHPFSSSCLTLSDKSCK